MILERSFLGPLDPMSLEVILALVVGVLRLELFYLRFYFWNLFLNFFWAFLEVFVLLEELFVDLGSWAFGFSSSILESFIAVLWICILAIVTWAKQLPY